jgi:hypothetical protein
MTMTAIKEKRPDGDGFLISFNQNEGFSLHLQTVFINNTRKTEKTWKKLREKLKEKYEGKSGRKYAVVFFRIGEKDIEITDFFKGAVLVDPKFYVRNMMERNKICAIAVDEFSLKEVWKSKASKKTDIGLYQRVLEVLDLFWHSASDLTKQQSKEYFEKNVRK